MSNFIKLRKKIENLKKSNLIKKGDKILIAFSGGPDSVFLFEVLNLIREEYLLEISLLYINHNLRDDVEKDLEFLKEFSRINKVPLYIESVKVREYSEVNRKSIELAARELRYSMLEKKLKTIKYDKIATGHNLDDNVETVLFRLLRGTSIKGMKGIPVRRKNIIRPILQFEKKEILNYLQERGKSYIIDYTNNEDDYTRNYIRNRIFPMFSKVNPDFRNKVHELIQEINEREGEKEKDLKNKDEFVEYLEKNNIELSREKINQIYNSLYGNEDKLDLSGSKEFHIGNNKVLRKKYGSLEILEKRDPAQKKAEKKEKNIEVNKKIVWKEYEIYLFQDFLKGREVFFNKDVDRYTVLLLNKKFEKFRLYVRKRKEGDVISLKNLGHKKLKKILIDEKISKWERDNIPVLEIEFEENGRKRREILSIGNIKNSEYVYKLRKIEDFDFKEEKHKEIIIIGRKNGR